ncbi:MAG TPA: HAMP domain-containing sensor histidine kinase, partial [Leptolyngbyaceae cyanobacterium]
LKIPNPQSVIIRIRDNGPGMTETVKKHLFDPFFTTKPVGKGTGLGLSISYQIVVEKHGGFLTCRSQPGQGSEFWIEIPLAPAESQNVDQRLQTNLMMSPYLMESVA